MAQKITKPHLKYAYSLNQNRKQEHFEYFQHLQQKLLNQSDKMTTIFSTKVLPYEQSSAKSDYIQRKKTNYLSKQQPSTLSLKGQQDYESSPKKKYVDIMAKLKQIKQQSQRTIQNLKSSKPHSQKQIPVQHHNQSYQYVNVQKKSEIKQIKNKEINKLTNLINNTSTNINFLTLPQKQSSLKVQSLTNINQFKPPVKITIPQKNINFFDRSSNSSSECSPLKKLADKNPDNITHKQINALNLLKKTSSTSSRSSAQLIKEVNKITKKKNMNNIPQDYDQEQYNHLQKQQQIKKNFDFNKRTSSSSSSSSALMEEVRKMSKIKSKTLFSTFTQLQSVNYNQNLHLNDFQIIKYLQEGQFGSVYVSRHKKTNFICALKKISKKIFEKQQKFINQLIQQIKIQAFLDHPNIVQLYSYFCDEDNFYLMMQLCCSGNVYNDMKREGYYTQQKVKTIIKQVSHAIQFMHDSDIIHRDIKPQNILLHEGVAKVCDFGWSIHSPMLRGTLCGTPLYSSPQMIQQQSYDNKIDIWNIGILTYELLYGVVPFQIRSHEQLIKIVEQQIYFPKSIKISEAAISFINNCLHKNSKERHSMIKLIDHQFLH